MIKVRKLVGTEYIYITLQDALKKYHQNPPEGWFEYIKGWVNEGMNIHTEEAYNKYLKKMNLKWFYYEKVNRLYQNLKKSKYNDMFDDDILRYISHIYGLGYFERTNYEIDINNPDLDKFLNTKNIFSSSYVKSQLEEYEKYSLMDLLPLKNGMNAIRRELLSSSKW